MDDTPCRLSDIFASPITYPILTCAELDSGNYNRDFLIADVLVAREPAILAGAKKSLKTSISIDLALSLATATDFLGRFPVKRSCRVLVMSGESGAATLQETARRIARSKGVELPSVDKLLWSEALPQFGDPKHLVALDRMLQAQAIEVLVCDPAYLAMGNMDPRDLFDVGSRLRAINDVCQAHGTTLILNHHCRKGQKNQFDVPQLEEIAFAGFQEWARQWLLLGRQERYEPGTGRHRLWLSVGGSAGHNGLYGLDIDEGVERPRHWEVRVASADDSRQEIKADRKAAKLADLEAKLLAAVETKPGATQTALAGMAGASNQRTKEALTSMIQSGKLRTEQQGSKTFYFLGA